MPNSTFLELLETARPALATAEREWAQVAAKEAPSFNALSLVAPDENRLSDIIKELLDPHGTHGQGELFLKHFVSKSGLFANESLHQVTIHRESSTIFIANQKRRMDILVDGGTWGVAIENKPWAGEQRDQLQDYAEDLERRFGAKFLLIRLTGRDVEVKSLNTAQHTKLNARRQFASWRFDGEFVAWLIDCHQSCLSPRVSNFLDELARYITAEFSGVKNHRTDMDQKHLLPVLESLFSENPIHFHAAAAIAEQFPVLRQKFVSKLFNEVEAEVLATLPSGWSADQNEADFVGTNWSRFSFTHKDWNKLYYVCLESQPSYGLVVLGIWHFKDKGVTRNDVIQQELKRLGWGKKSGGPWWDGHSPLPTPFADWFTSSGFASIVNQREELKKLLVSEFIKLCTHFQSPLAKLAKSFPKGIC